MTLDISIIIPTLGHVQNLKRLLQSIQRQVVDFSRLEVLVILNGQSPDTFLNFKSQFEQNFPFTIKFELLSARGVSAARNLGIQRAQGHLLYFLDDDCELHLRNTLSYHIDQHHLHPELFAIGGGYLLPSQAGLFDEIYNHIQMSWFLSGQYGFDSQLRKTQYLLGGNFSAKSSILKNQKIRFDDSIAYGGSESALFKQAVLAGLQMSTCPVEVTHHTEESAAGIRRKVYRQGRGQALIHLKYPVPQVEMNLDSSENKHQTSYEVRYAGWLWFYNYVFWAGYYSAEGKSYKLLSRFFSDVIGRFNGWRFALVDRLNRKK